METKDHILYTALMCFIEYGYDKISLNEIIKKTELTKGAFYYYFSSKDQLINDVIETYLYRYVDRCMGKVKLVGETAEEKLYSLPGALLNSKECLVTNGEVDNKKRKGFYILFLNSLEKSDKLNDRFNQAQIESIQSITTEIETLQGSGFFKKDYIASEIAELLFAAYRGAMLDWITGLVTDVEAELHLRIGKFERMMHT